MVVELFIALPQNQRVQLTQNKNDVEVHSLFLLIHRIKSYETIYILRFLEKYLEGWEEFSGVFPCQNLHLHTQFFAISRRNT